MYCFCQTIVCSSVSREKSFCPISNGDDSGFKSNQNPTNPNDWHSLLLLMMLKTYQPEFTVEQWTEAPLGKCWQTKKPWIEWEGRIEESRNAAVQFNRLWWHMTSEIRMTGIIPYLTHQSIGNAAVVQSTCLTKRTACKQPPIEITILDC